MNYGLGNIIALTPIIVLLAVAMGIGPGVTMAIQAWLYNQFARWFGGVVIRVDAATVEDIEPSEEDFNRHGKSKREMTEEEYVQMRLAQRRRELAKNDPNVREL
jgi:hypothetical protein